MTRNSTHLIRSCVGTLPRLPPICRRFWTIGSSGYAVVPFAASPKRRVALLIDAAGQYYLHGQKVFNAVEPIALAVMLAEQQGDQAQLRRALSIQGLILTATRNTPDALRSLMQALDMAEGHAKIGPASQLPG